MLDDENIETSQESSNVPDSPQGEQGESSTTESLRDTLAKAFDRARDESGKFKAKEPEAAPTATAPEVPQAATTEATAPAAPVVRPPDAWSPAAKSKFAELPADIQAEIQRREEEVHKGFTKFDEERVLGKQIKDVISPYMPMIRAEGGNEKEAISNLLQTAYTLRTAAPAVKRDLILGLAQQYGVDLGLQQQFQPQNGYGADPTVQQLQSQVQQLTQFINGQQQTVKQQEDAQTQSMIQSFASDPANLYFEDVKPHMAALLQNGQAATLQEAYEQACWARPDIRLLMLQSQEKQALAKKQEQANKARAAAGSVAGGTPLGGGTQALSPAQSVRDELQQQFAALKTGRI